MSEKMNYILGGGVSGLIAGYLTGYPVIEKSITKIPPLFFLWKTEETEDFVRRLNFDVKTRRIKIGYYYKGDFVSPNEELRKIYSNKIGRDSSMSEMKTELKTIDIDINDFLSRLKENVKFISDEIIAIKGKKLIGKDNTYNYNKLVSTIPLPKLLSLLNMSSKNLIYSPIFFFKTKIYDEKILNSDYDYFYVIDENIYIYRITKQPDSTYICESLYPSFMTNWRTTLLSIRRAEFGKILEGSPPDLSSKNIILLGRFAEWNSKIRTHDVIKKIKKELL